MVFLQKSIRLQMTNNEKRRTNNVSTNFFVLGVKIMKPSSLTFISRIFNIRDLLEKITSWWRRYFEYFRDLN